MHSIPRVLVVDDTPSNVAAVESLLGDSGVEVVKASSGNEALKLSLTGSYALVLMDVGMPGMSGYEVASLLRSSARTRDVPIIFLTGTHIERHNIFRGYESGAVDYITKPVNPVVLRSKVRVFAELFLLRERELQRVAEAEKARFEEEKRQLLEAENVKLKSILDNMMMTVAVFEPTSPTKAAFINRRFPWMDDVDLSQVFAKDGTHIPVEEQVVARALRGEVIFGRETRLRLKDGKTIHLLLGATPVKNKDGAIESAVVSVLDVTARVEAEAARELAQQQLQQSYKMAALGEMAGGIAHEVNNPLAIIIGKSRQLREAVARQHGEDSPLLKFTAAIEETSHRIVKIVNGLRTISRNAERDPLASTSVKSIIDGTLAICAARFKYSDIELIQEGDHSVMISCRAAEISQVLLNLIGNALDAVEPLGEKWVKLSAGAAGSWVQISVEDSGAGIPGDLREKILQPFFTTKEVGKGTGLGLSISKSIVEGHGGQLLLDEDASHTRFVVRLPAA